MKKGSNDLTATLTYSSTELQFDYVTPESLTVEVSKSHADSYNEGNHNALVEGAAAVVFYILETKRRRSFNICLHLQLSCVFLLLFMLAQIQLFILRLSHNEIGILSQPSSSDSSSASSSFLILAAAWGCHCLVLSW